MISAMSIVARPGAEHQERHAAALAAGLAAHGVRTALTGSVEAAQAQHVACWGWRTGARLRERGHDVLVMERGYIGDRFAWTSLGWNGLNGLAAFERPDDSGARFREHFDGMLKPWNPAGDYVLLIGQVPGDASLRGRDLSGWYAKQAAIDWRRPVRFRPHPVAVQRGIAKPVAGAETMGGPLADALAGAAWVVTYNSNTGVESLLAGKPTHVDDRGSMAWGATNREAWAHGLAWCQWSIDEIRSGAAWDVVRKAAPKEKATA